MDTVKSPSVFPCSLVKRRFMGITRFLAWLYTGIKASANKIKTLKILIQTSQHLTYLGWTYAPDFFSALYHPQDARDEKVRLFFLCVLFFVIKPNKITEYLCSFPAKIFFVKIVKEWIFQAFVIHGLKSLPIWYLAVYYQIMVYWRFRKCLTIKQCQCLNCIMESRLGPWSCQWQTCQDSRNSREYHAN